MAPNLAIVGIASGLGAACVVVLLIFAVQSFCKRLKRSNGNGMNEKNNFQSVTQMAIPLPSPQEPQPVTPVQPRPTALPSPIPRSSSVGAKSYCSQMSTFSGNTMTDVDSISVNSLGSGKTEGNIDSPGFDPIIGAIQPQLYQKCNVVLRQESEGGSKLGRLHLRLRYDFKTSDLVVHLIEAHDLPSMDILGGFSDPYIKVDLQPAIDNKIRKTAIKRRTLHPLFDEIFKFPITFDELRERQIIFAVYDYDKFSRNDVIGQVRFDFSTVDVSSSVEIWSDIQPFTHLKDDDFGELLLSLNYLPAAERLTVVVMKAKHLKGSSCAPSLDPYVKVAVASDGKVLKKKKTTTLKNTSEPVWNEAMVFHLSAAMIDKITLEITVNDHDPSGQREVLGHIALNKERHGKEGSHWKDTLVQARKTVAVWHKLHK